MSGLDLLAFLAGLLAFMAGAEAPVRGASRLAPALGITPLVIGLTVVAFGTSAPVTHPRRSWAMPPTRPGDAGSAPRPPPRRRARR